MAGIDKWKIFLKITNLHDKVNHPGQVPRQVSGVSFYLLCNSSTQKMTDTQAMTPGPPELVQPGKQGQPDQHAQQCGETEIGQPGHVRLRAEQEQPPDGVVDKISGIEGHEKGQHLGRPLESQGDQQAFILVAHPDLMFHKPVGKIEIGQAGDHEQEVLDGMEVIAVEPVPEIIPQGHRLQPEGDVGRHLSDGREKMLDILASQAECRIEPCLDIVKENRTDGQAQAHRQESQRGKFVVPATEEQGFMPDGTAQEDQAQGQQAHGQGPGPGHDPHAQGRDQPVGDHTTCEQEQKYLDIPADEDQITCVFRQSW